MSITKAQEVMQKRVLEATLSASVTLPNGSRSDLPRVVIQFPVTQSLTRTIRRRAQMQTEMVLLVETEEESYDVQNNSIVRELEALFPIDSRFDGVTIVQPPSLRAPLPPTDGVYAVPLVVRGQFTLDVGG